MSKLSRVFASSSLSVGAFVLLLTSKVSTALAATTIFNPDGSDSSTVKIEELTSNLGETILNLLSFLAGLAAIGYLVWGGIKYITAGGDAKKAEEARKAIINAVIGIIIISAAWFIINLAIGGSNFFSGQSSSSSTF